MPKRSLEFGERRLRLLSLVADAHDTTLETMIHRLIDLGLSVLPPVVPPHWSYLMDPQDNSAAQPATVPGNPPNGDAATDLGEDAGPAATPLSPYKVRQKELAWRVEQCFATYQRQYVRFRMAVDGLEVEAPRWNEGLRRWIVEALERHDGDMLGVDDRERWTKESRCRAAAVGIFLDPWFTGKDERANGKRYIEAERCWRALQGKVDPVPGFAEACFNARQAQRGGDRG